MPYSDKANVAPDQAWNLDGTAQVTPLPPFPDTSTRELPLEHRDVEGEVTIQRADYQEGLVIIPPNSQASGPSAILPLASSSGNSITLEDPDYGEWPDGIVVWFTDE